MTWLRRHLRAWLDDPRAYRLVRIGPKGNRKSLTESVWFFGAAGDERRLDAIPPDGPAWVEFVRRYGVTPAEAGESVLWQPSHRDK